MLMEIDKGSINKVADAVQDEFGWDTIEDDLMAIMAEVSKELRERMEREYQSARKQADWETRYYSQRDYGGRL
jgi:L-fucose mutarotase/ribose pyranase (RbsD/FucU family)